MYYSETLFSELSCKIYKRSYRKGEFYDFFVFGFQPQFAILTHFGKSWKIHPDFSEISVFRSVIQTDFWKTIFEKYRSTSYTFKYGRVFQKSVCVTPWNSINIIFRLNALFWMSFPGIGLAHNPNLNRTDQVLINFGWMNFP